MNDSIRRSLLAGHIGLLVISVFAASPTVDETAHLPAGLAQWQLNRFEIYRVNPPLVKMAAALPVLFMEPVVDWRSAAPLPGSRSEFRLGREFVEQNAGRVVWMLRAARLACLPFVLLGFWVSLKWASRIYGKNSGLVAAGLWSFSPLILGHGSLITPDVASASTGLLAIFLFRTWLLDSSWSNAIFLGIGTGIALLTKFTWAPLFPIVAMLAWCLWRLPVFSHVPINGPAICRDATQLLLASVVALFMVNSLYGFDRSLQRLADYNFHSAEFRGGVVEPVPEDGVRSWHQAGNRFRNSWLGALPVPLPACYLEGIDLQRRDFEPGQMSMSYLAGRWQRGGWWYYYIVGLAVKEPSGFLILLSVSILTWAVDVARRWRYRRRRIATESANSASAERTVALPLREDLLLLIPAVLVFWLVSRETGFNHHVRYIIPALPFLFIFASRIMVHAVGRPLLRWMAGGLMAWQIVSVLWFAPHWLGYFNDFAGGPQRGDEWLASSNTDWGQDLLHLKRWQESHPELTPVFTLLSSRYDPAAVGIAVNIPDFIQQKPAISMLSADGMSEEPESTPEPGWYAVSVNLLQPHRARLHHPHSMRINMSRLGWFRDQVPVDQAGYSIRIYHVPGAPDEKTSHVQD